MIDRISQDRYPVKPHAWSTRHIRQEIPGIPGPLGIRSLGFHKYTEGFLEMGLGRAWLALLVQDIPEFEKTFRKTMLLTWQQRAVYGDGFPQDQLRLVQVSALVGNLPEPGVGNGDRGGHVIVALPEGLTAASLELDQETGYVGL
jgi:hypothetical protein